MSDQEILNKANEYPHLWGKYTPEQIELMDKYSDDERLKRLHKLFMKDQADRVLKLWREVVRVDYAGLVEAKIVEV